VDGVAPKQLKSGGMAHVGSGEDGKNKEFSNYKETINIVWFKWKVGDY